MFGLTNSEGNHGEDAKEYWFYLDSTPTHSYLKCLYKYPQRAFPYGDLVAENGRRGKLDFEYELLDTGIFDEDRYFDVVVEYAKAAHDDILMRVTAHNRGPDAAHAARAADAVVPQHLVLGRRRDQAVDRRRRSRSHAELGDVALRDRRRAAGTARTRPARRPRSTTTCRTARR